MAGRPRGLTVEGRFWEKVSKGMECWEWNAARLKTGYGMFRIRTGKTIEAHRMSWTLANGDPGDMCVLHKCDNPSCVRPDHLFLGTKGDNHRDMEEKGRMPLGEDHGNSKLTAAEVRSIRRRRSKGHTLTSLAREFGVSSSNISFICGRVTWRHVN